MKLPFEKRRRSRLPENFETNSLPPPHIFSQRPFYCTDYSWRLNESIPKLFRASCSGPVSSPLHPEHQPESKFLRQSGSEDFFSCLFNVIFGTDQPVIPSRWIEDAESKHWIPVPRLAHTADIDQESFFSCNRIYPAPLWKDTGNMSMAYKAESFIKNPYSRGRTFSIDDIIPQFGRTRRWMDKEKVPMPLSQRQWWQQRFVLVC